MKTLTVKDTVVKRCLSLQEAAAYLGLSYWTLRTMLHNGEIPFVRAGRRILVDRVDLDAWITSNKYKEDSYENY